METKTFTTKAQELGYLARFNREDELTQVIPADPTTLTVEVYLPRIKYGELSPAEVQTVGWGAKTAEEITEVIKAYENALAMVELINKYQAAR